MNQMQQIQEIESYLEHSLEDFVMSRNEVRGFRELVKMVHKEYAAISTIRRLAFRLAASRIDESHQVMDWLEAVVKVLYAKENEIKSRAYFSPGEDCLHRIKMFIGEALQTLDICVFTITDDRIVRSLEKALEKGVRIRLISDNDKSRDRGADVQRLADMGIPTVLDATGAHMHHKFAIADGKRLLSGSYNWTRSACLENDENIIVTNDPALVAQFSDEFERLWEQLS